MTSRTTRVGALTAALALPLGIMLAATPAMANDTASISVLHAIPEGAGAEVVDVFANGELLIDDFTPGTLETVEVPAGDYDLAVFADGQTPDGDEAILIAAAVEVPAGLNATVAAHLNAKGKPTLSIFVNDTAAIAAGEARLTVRHIAAAPAVDITVDGDVLFADLANPDEATADVPAGDYSAGVNLAGTKDTVLGPTDISLEAGANTIVYAWGSAEEDNLALATQVIDGLGHTPDGVPAGDGSTAGTPLWLLVAAAAGGIGVAAAGASLARNRA